MLKSLYRTLFILLTLIFFVAASAQADKGVFNAQITPSETFINTPTLFNIAAEVGSENLYISSVMAYQTDENGRPIARLGQMYDDGTHGDETAADTVFTLQLETDQPTESKLYYVVTAAYYRERNRYMSPVMEFNIYDPVPNEDVDAAIDELDYLEVYFQALLGTVDFETAKQLTLEEALNNPSITEANLYGNTLSIVYKDGVNGVAFLDDPANPTDSFHLINLLMIQSTIAALPDDIKNPGNNKLLIFAPGYNDSSPQDKIADHAKSRFDSAALMEFSPSPVEIKKDTAASLEVVKKWGDYGAVVMHTHGGYWSIGTNPYVILRVGTLANDTNKETYKADITAKRLGVSSSGKFVIYPSFITKHATSMKNTFFYMGACDSMKNDTMWNALKSKGAKVGFGWSETVYRSFNLAKFEELINPMLPTNDTDEPLTAKQAFDAISDKDDSHTTPAVFTMKTASTEWNNFVFQEGGIINGDFESGDWTGWTTGGDYDFRIISGARKHTGSNSAALGRWDTAYHGYDPTSEPLGYEWMYQDFIVPSNVTFLKFYWWMETYDTAVWDWFDAYIKDTDGNTVETIVSKGGKPGTDYGPYWTTGSWREESVDISAYRGQKIRIYFDQRLDGYGDQQRVYIDDVSLE